MKIDRTMFLMLTGALAGVACASSTPPPESPTTAQADPSFPTITPAPPPPEPTPPAPPPAPTGDAISGGGEMKPVAPPPSDPRTIASNDEEGDCGKTKKKFDAAKKACSEDKAAPVNCRAVIAMPSSETCGGTQQAQQTCDAAKMALKPKIAFDAYMCMVRHNGKQNCDDCTVRACTYDALMGACPDPTAEADCNRIAARCKGLDTARCGAYLSGMSAKGRSMMASCMMNDCRNGMLGCLSGLHPSSE